MGLKRNQKHISPILGCPWCPLPKSIFCSCGFVLATDIRRPAQTLCPKHFSMTIGRWHSPAGRPAQSFSDPKIKGPLQASCREATQKGKKGATEQLGQNRRAKCFPRSDASFGGCQREVLVSANCSQVHIVACEQSGRGTLFP